MAALIEVCTTVAERADARRIAAAIVGRGLAACAHIEALESCYVWQGALRDEAEFRVTFKTGALRYAELEAALREIHPYELPAIYALPVEAAWPPYAAWVEAGSRGAG